MANTRWFGGFVGWMFGGPLGALLGFVIGSLVDSFTAGDSSQDFIGSDNGTEPRRTATSDRDNFLFSLLVMSACVIKADGKIMHSEMEYVRRFFRQNFGEQSVSQAEQILLQLFKHDIEVEACGAQVAANIDYSQRLQLLSYLVGIAQADGKVSSDEIIMLRRIAQSMRLAANEVDSLLNMGGTSLEDAYKVLEVASDVSNEDLRRAYKKLVLKHHPDRVASLGEDVRKAAEEKLKKINEAYDRICKERGI